MDTRCITRLALRNYKSIESCDIDLAPLTVLVGRNGVGKSNILDALRFTAEALNTTLEFAIRERGGIDQVRRKSLGGRPTHPGVALRIKTAQGEAEYSFRIAAVKGLAFRVDRERCRVFGSAGQVVHEFHVDGDLVQQWTPKSAAPAVLSDRLFLVAASGLPEFRPVWDALRRMTFHNLSPEAMKLPTRPEPGELLAHDGRNLASVIKQLQASNGGRLDRVLHFVRAIGVPVSSIRHKQAGALETIEIGQELHVPEGVRNSNFDAISLSDGTIRAIGILVSIVSAGKSRSSGPTLIGIEEPETALHPAAAGAMMEALAEGATETQIIVTCHSPDLLDHSSVTADNIRPVLLSNGKTEVGRLCPHKASLMKDHLSTAGELLRIDQLEPDPADLKRQAEQRDTLFESWP